MEISKIARSFKKPNGRFNVDLLFLLTFYDAYLRDRNLNTVAEVFGIKPSNISRIIGMHPELRQAMAVADENRTRGTLKTYVLRFMSKETRATWDEITQMDQWEKIEAVLRKRPMRIQQELFCYAILHSGYDVSKACAMVAVTRSRIELWKKDLAFRQMLEEVNFHKKNFFEKGLIGLVQENHPGAILFVNRTYNRDRGYGEVLEIEQGGGSSGDFTIDDLDLDLETKKRILAAIEKKRAEAPEGGFAEYNEQKALPATKAKR